MRGMARTLRLQQYEDDDLAQEITQTGLVEELGIDEDELEDLEAAIADYDEMIRLQPDFIFTYYARAIANSMLGRIDKAALDFEKINGTPKTLDRSKRKGFIMRLEGKVAIIAGAAWGGIGAATAYRFACEGAKVVVNTRRREEKLAETVQRIQDAGGEAVAVMGDVADEATWQALVENRFVKTTEKITTLVHNAAHSYTKKSD